MNGKVSDKILMLSPEEITLSSFIQRSSFDTYELDRLCESISSSGIIEPLCVRKLPDGKYELICGKRRLIAAKTLHLRRVPCVLRKADDISAAVYALSENIQRSALPFFDEAAAIQTLLNIGGFSQSELSIRLGVANSTLCNKLRLLKLDTSVRQRIVAANLTERHARALLQIPPEDRGGLLDKVIANGLNVKQTQDLIEEMLSPKTPEPEKKAPPVRKAMIGNIKLFANSLSKLILTLNDAGIEANSKRNETESYIEYKIRIPKTKREEGKECYQQLRMC